MDFYGRVLRLTFRKRWGSMPIALHVGDFAAAKAELEASGVVSVADVIDSGVCLQAFFLDPAGNQIGIHHRYDPSGV